MKRIIETPEAPAAVGPYSQAVIAGNIVYISGQVGLKPDTPKGTFPEYESFEAETHQVMRNLEAILGAAALGFSDVVKTQVFLTSPELFPAFNRVYGEYFPDGHFPARECVVAAPPLPAARVEISMIAVGETM